jgi:putative transposase
MCRILKVSRNGYYHWLRYGEHEADTELEDQIGIIFKNAQQTYGARRIKKALERQYCWIVLRRRIAKVMKKLGLKAKTKRRFRVVTTDSNHSFGIAPNRLAQDFYAHAPNVAYVGDITYIWTPEGWLYLATVIDLYARTFVGWAMDNRLHTPLITNALVMACSKRSSLQDAIFHSDRGSQYASDAFKEQLKNYGMIQSMSAKGNCYDNAVAESLFHTIKTELIHHMVFQTKKEAIQTITNYINFYNRSRMHSYNGYYSPMEKEFRWWQSQIQEAA